MRNKLIEILAVLTSWVVTSPAHGFTDSTKLSAWLSLGSSSIGPTLFGSKHTIPWNNQSTFNFTYFSGNSNHAVLAMIPGNRGFNFQSGIEKHISPSLHFSTGIGFQNCNLEVLRFNYDSTNGQIRYGISDDDESAFFPSRYKIKYNFFYIPVVLSKHIQFKNPRLLLTLGLGLSFKAAVGRTINTKEYFRSQDSNRIQTGVNILYNKSVGIAPLAQLGLEYSYNKMTNIFFNCSFENIATRQYQRIDLVDFKDNKYYYSSIFPSVSYWSLNIGVKRKIR